jgi:hypothetical protein
METLVDVPKHQERKLNLCLMGFKAKEGKTEKELMQRLNTKLLQGPNEVACQGHHRHATVTCHCTGLRPNGRRTPQHNVVQVHNERGPPSRAIRVQGPGGDQAKLGWGPHAHTTSTQVKAMAVVQGGQGGGQARLLACNRALQQRHSYLPALLYLGGCENKETYAWCYGTCTRVV